MPNTHLCVYGYSEVTQTKSLYLLGSALPESVSKEDLENALPKEHSFAYIKYDDNNRPSPNAVAQLVFSSADDAFDYYAKVTHIEIPNVEEQPVLVTTYKALAFAQSWKVQVGGLSATTTALYLCRAFEEAGHITSCVIDIKKDGTRSATVAFSTSEAATKAVEAFNGKLIGNPSTTIAVHKITPSPRNRQTPSSAFTFNAERPAFVPACHIIPQPTPAQIAAANSIWAIASANRLAAANRAVLNAQASAGQVRGPSVAPRPNKFPVAEPHKVTLRHVHVQPVVGLDIHALSNMASPCQSSDGTWGGSKTGEVMAMPPSSPPMKRVHDLPQGDMTIGAYPFSDDLGSTHTWDVPDSEELLAGQDGMDIVRARVRAALITTPSKEVPNTDELGFTRESAPSPDLVRTAPIVQVSSPSEQDEGQDKARGPLSMSERSPGRTPRRPAQPMYEVRKGGKQGQGFKPLPSQPLLPQAPPVQQASAAIPQPAAGTNWEVDDKSAKATKTDWAEDMSIDTSVPSSWDIEEEMRASAPDPWTAPAPKDETAAHESDTWSTAPAPATAHNGPESDESAGKPPKKKVKGRWTFVDDQVNGKYINGNGQLLTPDDDDPRQLPLPSKKKGPGGKQRQQQQQRGKDVGKDVVELPRAKTSMTQPAAFSPVSMGFDDFMPTSSLANNDALPRGHPILVRGLTPTFADDMLGDIFYHCLGSRGVVDALVVSDPRTGTSRGFGYVWLESEKLVEKAVRKFARTGAEEGEEGEGMTVERVREEDSRPMIAIGVARGKGLDIDMLLAARPYADQNVTISHKPETELSIESAQADQVRSRAASIGVAGMEGVQTGLSPQNQAVWSQYQASQAMVIAMSVQKAFQQAAQAQAWAQMFQAQGQIQGQGLQASPFPNYMSSATNTVPLRMGYPLPQHHGHHQRRSPPQKTNTGGTGAYTGAPAGHPLVNAPITPEMPGAKYRPQPTENKTIAVADEKWLELISKVTQQNVAELLQLMNMLPKKERAMCFLSEEYGVEKVRMAVETLAMLGE
ncbi:hypothetical protein YB2330_005635 [Saitoella coloradoensis]